ncbi:MAG: hypothetical protein MUO40_05860, partial [Anaerolineaceae bacterium]|nr:hypothetical protein [Anaerolineaceae bacterium]
WFPIMEKEASLISTQTRPDCTSGWSRLKVGSFTRVVGVSPNRVRSEPKKGENIIGMIYSGTSYKISEGPICADGLVFWKILDPLLPGGSGWTAEGDMKEYYLEPY